MLVSFVPWLGLQAVPCFCHFQHTWVPTLKPDVIAEFLRLLLEIFNSNPRPLCVDSMACMYTSLWHPQIPVLPYSLSLGRTDILLLFSTPGSCDPSHVAMFSVFCVWLCTGSNFDHLCKETPVPPFGICLISVSWTPLSRLTPFLQSAFLRLGPQLIIRVFFFPPA